MIRRSVCQGTIQFAQFGTRVLHGLRHDRVRGLGLRGRLAGDVGAGQGLSHAHGVSRCLHQVCMVQ
jgi:hypothetical protein